MATGTDTPQWIAASANEWGVPLLDVRPITQNMMSTSRDPQCAANALSFTQDDGREFAGQAPQVDRVVPCALEFRVDRVLSDGALFIPLAMEHKWALYLYGGQIICIRSWTRTVMAVADVRIDSSSARAIVGPVRGAFYDTDEEPELTVRLLDFLIRSHALDEAYPVPMPAQPQDVREAAVWCFSLFGNRALIATYVDFPRELPERPLRTDSLLHISLARGDRDTAAAQLDAGVPMDLLARDGLTPLHWAVSLEMAEWLLDRGCPVDSRSFEGATPLMNAVQSRDLERARMLCEHGADVNAADARGFTSLHRAAEMGQPEIVDLLIEAGADASIEANGITARSLADARGHADIVARIMRAARE